MNSKQNTNPNQNPHNLQNRPGKKPQLPRYKRGPLNYIIIVILILTVVMMMQQWQTVGKIEFSEFVNHIENGNIERVTVKETELLGQFTEKYLLSQEGNFKKNFVVKYTPEVHGEWIRELLQESGIESDSSQQSLFLIFLLQWVMPLIIIFGIILLLSSI